MANLCNNLFYYATKELSQDAFICWLCSFSLDEADKTDNELVKCSQNLISTFLEKGTESHIEISEWQLSKVEKQVGNIDVLLTLDFKGVKYKVIIEDKTHTSEHDNQLERYKDQAKKDGSEVIGIYFKTGFQSDYAVVEKAGYKVFNRKDILEVLNSCKSENAILCAYREYWLNFENLAQSYKDSNLFEWPDWQTVNGFYEEMQGVIWETGSWAGYGYVSNPSGGFWGLWYGPNDCSIIWENEFKVVLYLQVETKWNYDSSRYEYRVCTKMEDQSNQKDNARVLTIRDKVIERQGDYNFERPTKLRWGAVMTIGEYKTDKDNPSYEEFRDVIIKAMEKYQLLLNAIRSEL